MRYWQLTAGVDVATYFVNYQNSLAIMTMLVIAISHIFVQKWFDKRQQTSAVVAQQTSEMMEKNDMEHNTPPLIYIILPLLPLFLILTFSQLVITDIKMNVVTAR